ncbi:MAG TPA: carbohydrate-binding family 9-like protein [Sumerlaeia bacterium]|nr:carbohydrate-binding family 9-like protein [Sumerlaeia bacterium]
MRYTGRKRRALRRAGRYPLAAAAFLGVALGAAVAASPSETQRTVRVVQARRTDQAPTTTLDWGGVPSEQRMAPFFDAGDARADAQTRATVLYDDANLYVAVECEETSVGSIVALAQKHGDSSIFSDDDVEVFISPKGGGEIYYHFAANSRGARYEATGNDWSPASTWGRRKESWSVDAKVGEDNWTLLFTIPFAVFEEVPSEGSVWRINVCRQRRAGGKTDLTAWSPVQSSFHQPEKFGLLMFGDSYAAGLEKSVLGRWTNEVRTLLDEAKIDESTVQRLRTKVETLEKKLRPVQEAVRQGPSLDREAFSKRFMEARSVFDEWRTVRQDAARSIARKRLPAQMDRLARPGQKLLVYPVKAVTHRKLLPVSDAPEEISDAISIRGCRGEYEPASFAVFPLESNVVVGVTATDLKGPAGVIPAAAVDIRAVKCWYQSGSRDIKNEGRRVFLPELLLKDDDLVKVDERTKDNYVRLRFPDGRVQWKRVSGAERDEEGEYLATVCPIKDAKTLQPVRVPKHRIKQFWVTVRIPEAARAGVYEGKIVVDFGDPEIETLNLRLEALPFNLEPNPLESSVYFHWGSHLFPNGEGGAHFTNRSLAQYRWEFENLLAHGIDNPTVGVKFELLPTVLQMREEVGMKNDHLYYLTAYASQVTTETVTEIIEIAKGFGFEDVYFYGRDEARGEVLKQQRAEFEKIHQAGGKTFVAGYRNSNFPLIGDLQDLLVCAFTPSKDEAALWHSKDHKIFCYGNPQAGVEDPEVYRRNYGLLLDREDYDGGMTYIYYHGWNDFNIQPWRQHNFVYPTIDGGVDTIQWEGYREGIDDLRYLATLRKAVAEAEKSGDAAAKDAAAQARAFIAEMDVSGDLDAIRDEMIEWIRKLLGENG